MQLVSLPLHLPPSKASIWLAEASIYLQWRLLKHNRLSMIQAYFDGGGESIINAGEPNEQKVRRQRDDADRCPPYLHAISLVPQTLH